ncbi:hypothetical protein [Marinobacter zhejiangensis]|uniref:Uncharacterized protein n=1 Tax=Marinobacter zhejiangensis TaxID=488535 RepID=A0A1I4M295_9GAMM|nr:hypothetical protein [Marinobacter zhejiangensis]SFL97196.1 hypothetical protein SAMN04487963_0802 [Marinobacter zhejiangensis]
MLRFLLLSWGCQSRLGIYAATEEGALRATTGAGPVPRGSKYPEVFHNTRLRRI